MRSPLLVMCVLCLLACSSRKATEHEPPPPVEMPRPVETTYACELRDAQGLMRERWRNPPEAEVSHTFLDNGAALPAGFPREATFRAQRAGMIWSARLPRERRAWLWTNFDREPLPDGGFAEDWFFAIADAQGRSSVGPGRVSAWREVTGIQIKTMVVSSSGQIALVYWAQDPVGGGGDELLLIDADGTVLDDTRTRAPGEIYDLQATSSGEFAMLVRRSNPPVGSLTFAIFSERDGLHELREPIHESEDFTRGGYARLIALDDGYLVAREEPTGRVGSRLLFRRLNGAGQPFGEEYELLPEREAPFQGQLSWARFEQALVLLWVEGQRPYANPREVESDWPHDDERYRLMLISPRDLGPLSEALTIAKSDGLGDPRVFSQDGTLQVQAALVLSVSNDGGMISTTPSTPVAIDCKPESERSTDCDPDAANPRCPTESSSAQPDAGDAVDASRPAPSDVVYHCETPAGEALREEPWNRADWQPPRDDSDLVGAWSDSPSTPVWLRERGSNTRFWRFALPQARTALIFVDRLTREDGSAFDSPWQFATLDVQERLLAGPIPITAWGSEELVLKSYAISARGTLVFSYQPLIGEAPPVSTLLLDAEGASLGQRTYPGVRGIAALRDMGDGQFAMIMTRGIGDTSLTFATLSEDNVFREEREPLAESEMLLPIATIQLIPIADGLLLSWEERHSMPPAPNYVPTRASLSFRRLDGQGRPTDSARALLPASAHAFQRQLRWLRFHDALALIWSEGDSACSGDRFSCDWPEPGESDSFTLVSAYDLESRSEVIALPKRGDLGYPEPFLHAGELGAVADFWSEQGGLQSSVPLTISCAPE